MDNSIVMWNGFSEFWEHRDGVACKRFCLPGWLRCLVVASDRPRVIKLDNAVSNTGAQGLTESGEPGLVCEQWWNQVQASIFGELIIQNSSTRSERNLEEGRAERLGLAQWCQGKRKISCSFQFCFCMEFSLKVLFLYFFVFQRSRWIHADPPTPLAWLLKGPKEGVFRMTVEVRDVVSAVMFIVWAFELS